MGPPATLDTYLRSSTPSTQTPIRKRTASSADPAPSSKKPKKRTGSAKAKGKATSSAQKSGTKKKARKPFVPDTRNLGTLALLSDSSDEDALEVILPRPPAAPSVSATPAKRVMLEEEDWMREDGATGGVSAGALDAPAHMDAAEAKKEGEDAPAGPVALDDGPEGIANLLNAQSRLDDPAEQDPFDGCTDDEGGAEGAGDAPTGFTGCECGSDDEVLVVSEGPTCPGCKLLLETLPKKKRDAHVESCLSSSASTDVTPSNVGASTSTSAPAQSLFAPLSRLFSRAPPSASPAPSTSSAASDAKGKGKAPVSLLSSLPNAFTALMAGHAETKQWKAAEEADRQKGRRPKGEEKKVPFYKWIDGLEITVDAFKYGKIPGCKGYFLSHAHSDHYQQLSSSWSHGPIYASQTTINLIKLKLGVKDEWLHPLPLDTTVKVAGIDVTLIDANHCPGSVLFLFEGPHTDPKSPYSKTPNRIFRYLHCGDFRASPQHILHPCMSTPTPPSLRLPSSASMSRRTSSSSSSSLPWTDPLPGRTLKKLDAIYLDTTYLAPSYCFPAQELVISACADLVRERIVGGDEDALWRADGRDAERKGMKGWLSTTAAAEGGVKGEVKDEDGPEMMEMEALPEEEEMDEESQVRVSRIEEDGLDEPDGGDEDADAEEEAWRAAHGDEDESQAVAAGDAHERSVQDSPMPLAAAARAQGDEQPCGDEVELAKAEEEDVAPAVAPEAVKAEDEPVPLTGSADGDEVKPDVKSDMKSDVKPDIKPKKERLLVLVGTYSIGKERIVKAIAHALSTKIYCDARKRDLFLAQDDADLHALLTDDPLAAQVHVGGLRDITREAMSDYIAKWKAPRVEGGFTKMIGLRPTGWTYRSETKDKFPSIPKILQLEQQRKFSPAGLYPQRDSTPQVMAFGVPYSEHSSFFELTCFALSLEYTRIIPTVNVHTASSRNKMKGWIDRWAAEKKRRADARMPRIVPFRSENYW
ncbi:DNA cross-link repair protein PSO2/SNM1 [Rhodotorula kratochvilovae]